MSKRTRPIDVESARSVMTRIWSRVDIDPDSQCWVPRGNDKGNGYKQAWCDGRQLLVHRISWVAANGVDIPADLSIDHLCRNPGCCNPAHLDPVPHRVNVLRGQSPIASGAKRTHCIRGHLLSGDNLVPAQVARGERSCLTCARDRRRRQMDLIRAARAVLGIDYPTYIKTYGESHIAAQRILDGGAA